MRCIILGISGASGVIYGIELLKHLKSQETYLIVSESAKKIMSYETKYKLSEVIKLATNYYDNNVIDAKISSGTFKFESMVIMPCSLSTLSKIANGIEDNLITRVAAITLKEQRKLILCSRETPLTSIHLQNMLTLAKLNVIIFLPMVAFYTKPKSVDDVINYNVGRVLDFLEIEHNLYKKWQ